MARTHADTAKHLIRVIRKGGELSRELYSRISRLERDMFGRVIQAIKSGKTEAQVIAIVRKEVSAKKIDVLERILTEAQKIGAEQARSAGKYITVLTPAGTAVKVPLISKSWVRQAFNTPLGKSRITVFDLAEGANISSLRNFRNGVRSAFRDGATNREIANLLEEMIPDLLTPRYKIDAVARTAIKKVASESSMKTYRSNDDIIKAFLFSATLDIKTSTECKLLDGEAVEKNEASKIPPLHPSCRSDVIPILHGETVQSVKDELGRPQVVPKSKEEYEARKHTKAGRKPSTTDRSGLKRIDGGEYVDYSSWLAKQPAYYQKDILGSRAYGVYLSGRKTKQAFVEALGKT